MAKATSQYLADQNLARYVSSSTLRPDDAVHMLRQELQDVLGRNLIRVYKVSWP